MKKLMTILSACCLTLAAYAEPFSITGKTRIVIAYDEPENVELAAGDLARDIKTVGSMDSKVTRLRKGAKPRKGDIYIHTVSDGRWEAYGVQVKDGVLDMTGSDARGTMFAVYDFSEKYLGIDPMYWWNQAAVPSMEKLEWDDVAIRQDSPSVKFRGWFINDEDLLTAWMPSGGDRRVDYKFYKTVVNPEIMEHIAEALVRSRYNMIIPASFLWVLNAPEAKLLDICAKRGVYLSMHHIEPMGVSAFSYFYYWRDRGKELKFSYYSHPKEVEEVWRETAKVWAKYPNVIWQIGLRGIGDRPMWQADDATPQSDEERAAIISNAMKRQIEILDEIGVPKEGRLVSTTLWAEGSLFNDKGLLKIPEGTKVIFADNSPGWAWQDDFYNTVRKPEYKYGVYYHHALIGAGPHLASLVPAKRTYEMMKEACRMGADDYAIFNVSNIREFTYNIDATSRMLWNMNSYDPEKWTTEWINRHYSSRQEDWAGTYNMYYRSLQIHPDNKIPAFLDGYICQRFWRIRNYLADSLKVNPKGGRMYTEKFSDSKADRSYADTFWKSMSMNSAAPFDSRFTEYTEISAQAASFRKTMERSRILYESLPEAEKPFAMTTIVYPSAMMYHLSAAYREYMDIRDCYDMGDLKSAGSHRDAACEQLREAIALQDVYCTGKFEGWWNDCRKLDLKKHLQVLGELKL